MAIQESQMLQLVVGPCCTRLALGRTTWALYRKEGRVEVRTCSNAGSKAPGKTVFPSLPSLPSSLIAAGSFGWDWDVGRSRKSKKYQLLPRPLALPTSIPVCLPTYSSRPAVKASRPSTPVNGVRGSEVKEGKFLLQRGQKGCWRLEKSRSCCCLVSWMK
jgi:hypothetical protein